MCINPWKPPKLTVNQGVPGSSPGWGAKQVNHLHGFRVSGFFFRASFGPVFGGNSLFWGHKWMTIEGKFDSKGCGVY